GRLAGRHLEAARGIEVHTALFELLLRDEDVGGALLEVDADPVAGPEQRKTAARGRLGRGVEDRRRSGGAGLAAVADAGQRMDAALDERRGRLHVHDLGRARIADRARAADE